MKKSEFSLDAIEIHKASGQVLKGLFANVQPSKVFMEANGLLVETGDELVRPLSVGNVERYRVIDPGFRQRSLGFTARYQMRVQKI